MQDVDDVRYRANLFQPDIKQCAQEISEKSQVAGLEAETTFFVCFDIQYSINIILQDYVVQIEITNFDNPWCMEDSLSFVFFDAQIHCLVSHRIPFISVTKIYPVCLYFHFSSF